MHIGYFLFSFLLSLHPGFDTLTHNGFSDMRYDSTITTTKQFYVNRHGSYSVNIYTLILHDSAGKAATKLLSNKDIKHLLSKYASSAKYVKRCRTIKKIILLSALTELASAAGIVVYGIRDKTPADREKTDAELYPYLVAFGLSNLSLIALAHQPAYIRLAGIEEYNRIVMQRNIKKNKF
jgi:hypothetical protein